MKFVLLAGAIACISSSAMAQSCGGGLPSGTPGCIPPDNLASPLSTVDGSTGYRKPVEVWANRWGAIAVDNVNGGIGIGRSVGMRSKRAAERAALKDCRSKGGQACKIGISYGNQCAVIAWGDQHYSLATGVTIELAARTATSLCSKFTTNCNVYHAECSEAERIR